MVGRPFKYIMETLLMWVKVVENFRTNQELMRRKPDSWIIRRELSLYIMRPQQGILGEQRRFGNMSSLQQDTNDSSWMAVVTVL